MTSLGAGTGLLHHWYMSAPSETSTWRLAGSLRTLTYTLSLMLFGLGLLVIAGVVQAGSNVTNIVVGTVMAGVASPLPVLLARRVRLDLTPESLLVQNMLRSYRVDLSEVVSITPSRQGITIEYRRDGRSRYLDATAGEGLLDASLFPRMATRNQLIVDSITAQISGQEK